MRAWPARMMAVCGVLAFFLAASLASTLKPSDTGGGDVLVQTLGGTADLLADKAYMEADKYFHKGFAHEERCDGGDHGRPQQEPAPRRSGLPLMSWMHGIQDMASPHVVRHIADHDERELLPWFIVAARLNPKHIDAWCTGTYWFFRTGDKARAEEFAAEGIRHNPTNYMIRMERGILYHRMRRWKDSVRDLEAADRLCRDNNEDARTYHRTIRTFLTDARARAARADRQAERR